MFDCFGNVYFKPFHAVGTLDCCLLGVACRSSFYQLPVYNIEKNNVGLPFYHIYRFGFYF